MSGKKYQKTLNSFLFKSPTNVTDKQDDLLNKKPPLSAGSVSKCTNDSKSSTIIPHITGIIESQDFLDLEKRTIHESWLSKLNSEFQKPYFIKVF